jgi:hypothetical protein
MSAYRAYKPPFVVITIGSSELINLDFSVPANQKHLATSSFIVRSDDDVPDLVNASSGDNSAV